jgi:hypothetical protein
MKIIKNLFQYEIFAKKGLWDRWDLGQGIDCKM